MPSVYRYYILSIGIEGGDRFRGKQNLILGSLERNIY